MTLECGKEDARTQQSADLFLTNIFLQSATPKLYNALSRFWEDPRFAISKIRSEDLKTGIRNDPLNVGTISEPSIDFQAVLSRMGNNWKLFREVTAMIMEDYRIHLDAIDKAAADAAWEDVKSHAHALRGLVATYQTSGQPYSILLAIEDAVDRTDYSQVEELRALLTIEIQTFVSKIQLFVEVSDVGK